MRTILGFIPLASMWLSVRRQTRRPDKPSSQRYYSEYTCTFRPTTTLYRCDLKIGKLIQCQVASDTEKHVVVSAQLASGKQQAIWRLRLCTYRLFTESRYRLTAWNLENGILVKGSGQEQQATIRGPKACRWRKRVAGLDWA
ncbi:hypothetical protein BDV09DRAFT_188899 [Aspergillus tetrazonus]